MPPTGEPKGKKQRPKDKHFHLAKERGYRSRAACKLLQLDDRFRFLPSARAVLDLGAAPGGWTQLAVSRATIGALVVGVDLAPIRPIRGARLLKEDITAPKCRSKVRRLMDSRGVAAFDVVLHDGDVRTAASPAQEEALTTQSALVINAIRQATMFLAPGGAFITKFFRCQDYHAVMFCLKQLFERVEFTRPSASRRRPAEIYLVCMRYKAPAKIQPELLDLKHLHLLIVDAEKSKGKRRPGGRKWWMIGLASDFIWSNAQTPLEFLGSFMAISFDDPASLPIKSHELTTEEIIWICGDLRLMDKNRLKYILKWRMRIRTALSCSQVIPTADGTAMGRKGKDDDQLLQEMEELIRVIDTKERREKKSQSRRRPKEKAHKAIIMQIDATEYCYGDPDLFFVSDTKGGKEPQAVESAEDGDSNNEETQTHEDSDEAVDSDEELQRYEAQLEVLLDEAYERIMTTIGGGMKEESKLVKHIDLKTDAHFYEGVEESDDGVTGMKVSDENYDQEKANPLLFSRSTEKLTKEQLAKMWFSQDVFS
ncbi:adoMet-dependent rRNA methyltransferase spb1-like [Triticum dicoccoides]|uniref:adoMet-dependent rRNA methyltransferase spb1-like n=1 Tax=Triticum dicoccoides TaxID=85692 RepID=UPI0018918FFA|nr:adoMet-dependent rRNA methyltransferase spb1-like [Triticum dicoccoides]